MTSRASPDRVLGVGIIGCGEITQVIHIPTLGFMSDYFKVTYLCDVSEDALVWCRPKFGGSAPKSTRDPAELCAAPDVDIVFVVNSDEYHPAHAILALQHDKHVFVEKPMALNQRDVYDIIDAERKS